MLMLSCCVADCGVGAESMTFTVKVFEPALVGVPEITPVLGSSVRPAGRLVPGITLQERGAVPPVDCKVALYTLVTLPPGKVVVVITGDGFAVTVTDAEAVFWAAEVAFTATAKAALRFAGAL